MASNKLPGIDATKIRCPEFTGPILRLLKQAGANTKCVIKTKEPNALKRLTHLCESYEWEVFAYTLKEGIHYIGVQINQVE